MEDNVNRLSQNIFRYFNPDWHFLSIPSALLSETFDSLVGQNTQSDLRHRKWINVLMQQLRKRFG